MARQPKKTKTRPRIGFLNSGMQDAFADCVTAFKQDLNQAGYVDGTNVDIEYKWAEGDYRRLGRLPGELVDAEVDVIAASGGVTPAKAAQDATSTIPIVFVCGFDPADPRVGLVKNLTNPGGNATGVNIFNTELLPRRRELLSELVPDTEVALLLNPGIFLSRTG
jgi:ABC-type uncharacterized transport system substrate-binding protein